MSGEIKARLITLLKKYSAVFACKPTYLTGVDRLVIEHSLNIMPRSNPVIQKKRGLAEDPNRAINAEVANLLTTQT